MKRAISLFLVLTLMLVLATPVMAAEQEAAVSPRYTYIAKMIAALKINNAGLSTCNSSCLVPDADRITLTCTLQRYNGSSWTAIKTWSTTGTPSCAISKNYAVYSGYTYRLRTTCSVYRSDGLLLESGTIYSNQVVY